MPASFSSDSEEVIQRTVPQGPMLGLFSFHNWIWTICKILFRNFSWVWSLCRTFSCRERCGAVRFPIVQSRCRSLCNSCSVCAEPVFSREISLRSSLCLCKYMVTVFPEAYDRDYEEWHAMAKVFSLWEWWFLDWHQIFHDFLPFFRFSMNQISSSWG